MDTILRAQMRTANIQSFFVLAGKGQCGVLLFQENPVDPSMTSITFGMAASLKRLADAAGVPCEVAFWIDYCCCEQDRRAGRNRLRLKRRYSMVF